MRQEIRHRPTALASAVLLAVCLGCGSGETTAALDVDDGPAASDNEEVRNRGEGKDQWWLALPRPAWSEFPRVEQSQDWFEVYEIRPDVLAIYEPGQFEEIISYLIIGSERALLFDTGLGIGDMRRLVDELTDREAPSDRLSVVVLNSHTHYDHVGGNHAFETVYGTGLDYTREHARGRPHEEVAEFVGDGWIWKDLPAGFSVDDYRSRPFTLAGEVIDGQVLSLGNVELEVLLTPGHAPDSLCLLDRERRLLFTGDTFYPATLYAHLPGSAFSDYERTADRLASLAEAVDVVLPAHNEPTMPSSELVALRDAFAAMREDATPFVLTDGNREYDFGRFSILVTDPPPWQAELGELLFEETFDAQSLEAGWSWLREDPAGWRFENNQLRIRTNGQLWESKNTQKNVLLRATPGGAVSGLAVEVTVDGHLELDQAYEHGGLIWYLDDDNWVTLTLLNHVEHKTQKLLLVAEIEGRGLADTSEAMPFTDRSVTLRLLVDGSRFTGLFRRASRPAWEELGTIMFNLSGPEPKIGLVAGQGREADEHWVAFDDFRIRRLASAIP